MEANEFYATLRSFGCTATRYEHKSGMLFTEGVKFLAEATNTYWLLDVIASSQPKALRDYWLQQVQFWELFVRANRTATIVCSRDSEDVAFRLQLKRIDFPFEYVMLHVEDGVVRLPSEHSARRHRNEHIQNQSTKGL